MKAVIAAVILAAGPAGAVDVPSGQPVSLQEVLQDAVGPESWLRFRFVAPDISRDADYEVMADDMLHLCDEFALPYLVEYELQPDVIVISLADRATEFGVADRDATQFFEAFRPGNKLCIWEGL